MDKDIRWYKEKWSRGHVLENAQAKLIWDFEFNLRTTTTSRRPDLILEDQEKNKTYVFAIWRAQKKITLNEEEREMNDIQTFRERRVGYKIIVVPLVRNQCTWWRYGGNDT